MHVSFNNFGMYSIATAEIDETKVSGSGGGALPCLWIPLRLDITLPPALVNDTLGFEIVELSSRLSCKLGLISQGVASRLGYAMQNGFSSLKDAYHNLEFPLDTTRISALERLRSGGDVHLRLDAEMPMRELVSLNASESKQAGIPKVWGFLRQRVFKFTAELNIPRDVWITRVLPSVGYGVVHVLELPATPLESCQRLDHAFKALKQAQEKHLLGDYDDAVGKCRVALDKFFTYELSDLNDPKSQRIPVLKRDWETKLGQATYDWLNKSFGAIKTAANQTHHSPDPHYNQLESQMILAITTALVAYVARVDDSSSGSKT